MASECTVKVLIAVILLLIIMCDLGGFLFSPIIVYPPVDCLFVCRYLKKLKTGSGKENVINLGFYKDFAMT